MLTIVGGTYLEVCREPPSRNLYGSGLRAAAALSNIGAKMEFISCVSAELRGVTESVCATFGINAQLYPFSDTIFFAYNHPLSLPILHPGEYSLNKIHLPELIVDCLLQYGMVEANVKINAKKAVYDPQNQIGFKASGSVAGSLALVLNLKEAVILANEKSTATVRVIAKKLQKHEDADIVVIKDGPRGAFVFDGVNLTPISIYRTTSVWPIGSGDIFSAAFAWQWMIQKKSPVQSAINASKFTAQYCETKVLPLPSKPGKYKPITAVKAKKIYLAGPFYSFSEKLLVNEIRQIFRGVGHRVFSPFHDIGAGDPASIAPIDLKNLDNSDLVYAIVDGTDPGTMIEIGYAKAKGIPVIAFTQKTPETDLFMLKVEGVQIVSDFATSIYMASW